VDPVPSLQEIFTHGTPRAWISRTSCGVVTRAMIPSPRQPVGTRSRSLTPRDSTKIDQRPCSRANSAMPRTTFAPRVVEVSTSTPIWVDLAIPPRPGNAGRQDPCANEAPYGPHPVPQGTIITLPTSGCHDEVLVAVGRVTGGFRRLARPRLGPAGRAHRATARGLSARQQPSLRPELPQAGGPSPTVPCDHGSGVLEP